MSQRIRKINKIKKNQPKPVLNELNTRAPDHLASVLKSLLGAIPYVGSGLSELISYVIPNQRIERISKFASTLNDKLDDTIKELFCTRLTDENFSDLTEEGLRAAANSLSDERREYVAELIKRGISASAIEIIELKQILKLLGELNDIEIIWLRSHAVLTSDSDHEFREKHKEVLRKLVPTMGSSQDELDRYAIQDAYIKHLARLGLLEPVPVKAVMTDKVINYADGTPMVSHYQITLLGQLILRRIGLKWKGV